MNLEEKVTNVSKKWEEADLCNAKFYDCRLEKAKFDHGIFHGASFNRFIGEDITFRMSNMQRSQFLNVNLVGAYVNGSNLSDMHLENNKWTDMTMTDCKVYGQSFENGVLENTLIRKVKIKNLNLEDCDISGLRINGVLIDDLLKEHGLKA